MKKQIIAMTLVAGLTLATVASANWGKGGYGGQMGYGGCQQVQQGQVPQQLDQATQDKISQFFKDNSALRKEIVMKQAEKRALMHSTQPDAKAVAAVTGELFDLRTSMHEKAELAGVDQYIGPRRGLGGPGLRGRGPCGQGGPGKGFGKKKHMRGYDQMSGWNQQ
ncbi:MAG: periplasmic heavy metal sensor [Desulforhopalus sp.]